MKYINSVIIFANKFATQLLGLKIPVGTRQYNSFKIHGKQGCFKICKEGYGVGIQPLSVPSISCLIAVFHASLSDLP
jgi:hypothetical protein